MRQDPPSLAAVVDDLRAKLLSDAAPDMLAALYKAQVSLCDAWSPRDKAALAAVNAAIAKARGD
jgi:hypothetical protein